MLTAFVEGPSWSVNRIYNMLKCKSLWVLGGFLMVFLLGAASLTAAISTSDLKTLPGHVPPQIARMHMVSTGKLNPTNVVSLAIGLPLRNTTNLDQFLANLANPASPEFHQYLTPAQFTDRFGPTTDDYQQVIDFAQSNGLEVVHQYENHVVLDVRGTAENVERAFHLQLRTYQHPNENRVFYAPDVNPSVPASLPVVDVTGLSTFQLPKPKMSSVRKTALEHASPHTGSGPGGAYMGDDFRKAYVPGTPLTGAGQLVGLLQFDGYYMSDVTNYAAQAGRTNIPLINVYLNNYDGTPTPNGNIEVSLDIEMVMSMAPGLAGIVMFEAGPYGHAVDILGTMVSSNQIKQLSCSWGWNNLPYATMDNLFMQMQAQGQSFYSASGDSDAFTTGSNTVNGVDNPAVQQSPASSPYITQVGGTTLTTSGRQYSSETVWNWGGGQGSSGGISSWYGLPSWQQGIDFAANPEASPLNRNIPDVALTADNVYILYANGSPDTGGGGTSCASPLWAAFTALVNQQAAQQSKAPVGFINPIIYELANENLYGSTFHDVTVGDNTSADSTNLFHAFQGYDLCTGLGTPRGTNLINALLSPDQFVVAPNYGLQFVGVFKGPFNTNSQIFSLTNELAVPITWSVVNTSTWLQVSSTGGTLSVGNSAAVTVSLTAVASNLLTGTYSANIWFTNLTTGISHVRHFSLQTMDAISVQPAVVQFNGAAGELLTNEQTLVVSNSGSMTLNWSSVNSSALVSLAPQSGSLDPDTSTNVMVSLTAAAAALPGGVYPISVFFNDLTNGYTLSRTITLAPSQNILLNGGFETGDFTDWTLVGDTVIGSNIYNSVVDTNTLAGGDGIYCVHSGRFGVAMGEAGYLAYLSQSLYTQPGGAYLISLWVQNPYNDPAQEFQVNWNTNVGVTSTLFDVVEPGQFGWTNMTFVVTATDTNSTLQFGAQNDSAIFGLDDVSVTPIPLPTIQSLTWQGNSIHCIWNSVPGVSYTVQFTTDLSSGIWVNDSTNTATGYIISKSIPMALDPTRFYRILVSP